MWDYIVAIAALVVVAAASLAVLRAAMGPARSAAASVTRALLAGSLTVVVVGVGIYQVTKSRTFQLAGALVDRVEIGEKVVALTFDDGPTPEYTREVLDVLAAHDASATFYVTGSECARNPQLAAAMAGAGHELGNHTYSHQRLYFVPRATVADEVERTDAIVRSTGYDGPLTFRPPGCKRLLETPLYLRSTGRTTVTWDLEPDSIAAIADDPEAIADHVVDGVHPGSIVLMHVMYEAREPSRRALPLILDRLAAKGYRFVTVSDLLARR